MKNFTFLAVAVAMIGFYAFPVFLAQADSATTVSGGATLTTQANAAALYLHITAYSSDVDQTDNTPFITANGTYVHDGIVATNLLPFGTQVQIPALFGDKIFTVEDRMNHRMTDGMDIWMPSRARAIFFGSNYANVVVLGNDNSPLAVAK
jgi:3D (Asp-Asp-Asp) domain-containing protein